MRLYVCMYAWVWVCVVMCTHIMCMCDFVSVCLWIVLIWVSRNINLLIHLVVGGGYTERVSYAEWIRIFIYIHIRVVNISFHYVGISNGRMRWFFENAKKKYFEKINIIKNCYLYTQFSNLCRNNRKISFCQFSFICFVDKEADSHILRENEHIFVWNLSHYNEPL